MDAEAHLRALTRRSEGSACTDGSSLAQTHPRRHRRCCGGARSCRHRRRPVHATVLRRSRDHQGFKTIDWAVEVGVTAGYGDTRSRRREVRNGQVR